MGEIVQLEDYRRRRETGSRQRASARGGSPPVPPPRPDPVEQLAEAVRELEAALEGVIEGGIIDQHEICRELRAVNVAVARRRYVEASRRAEDLLARLRPAR